MPSRNSASRTSPTSTRAAPPHGKTKSPMIPSTTSASATPIMSGSFPGIPGAKPQLELEDHDPLLRQLADGVGGALAGVAGGLHASVRHLVGAEGRCLVDGDAAEVEPLRGAEGGADVRREDPGLEAVAGAVRALD